MPRGITTDDALRVAHGIPRRGAGGEGFVHVVHHQAGDVVFHVPLRGQHLRHTRTQELAGDADAAFALGLVTAAPDDIDWADEVRMALEERAAMSPDALTGLEANLRFAQKENMATRVFGRLTAWQNWIFQRPNAVGEKGALKVYGKGDKAAFDWNRV